MSAQIHNLYGNPLEALSTIALFLALVLTALGVVAHATFA